MNSIVNKFSVLSFIVIIGAILVFGRLAGSSTGATAPELLNDTWLNSKPLHLADLKGKVVMVEFWTFGCSNCRAVQPYVKAWHKKYADQGFVVIGVHSPEFSHEADINNVKNYLQTNDITYPVAIDNDFATWKRYNNRYWPARYLIDKQGIVRQVYIGEGEYRENEQQIQALLAEH